ncbi:probable transcriptional regulatory protein CLOSPI_02004 [Firmicutes bacterium CAG:884]|nr:YebC/PmpR family DNA-binding transcriptional regulator [Bacillota bacterium]CCY94480.1 probable transcriptional regulatory protein CLOSPI_02004 [Firmicutes bacterium CAG:884]
MGRFPNIAAAKAKTGAARGKLYGMYAKEIYLAAKNGGTTPEGNPSLKRLIEKAKKEQVPSDVIKRAIDKVTNGVGENYEVLTYEIFGPSGSTMLVECLTDNVNRSVSEVRAVINKSHLKMGAMGSVAYMYDNLSVVGFKGLTLDEAMEALITADVPFIDIENDNDMVIIYGNPNDINKIKDAITNYKNDITFDIDEVTNLPKDKVKLEGEDLELFQRALNLFDEVDDVANVYHNVEL